MKTLQATLAIIFLLGLTSSLAAAQEGSRTIPWKIDVAFAFHVGAQVFPAGTYFVDSDGPFTRMTSLDRKHVANFLTNADATSTTSYGNRLEFNTYGDERFLARVSFGETGRTSRLMMSKDEVIVASGSRSPNDTAVGQ